VLETAKGVIEIRLFRARAPKSVDHVLELIKRSFYRGQRFHRATPMLVQTGDPQSRDMSKEAYWATATAAVRSACSNASRRACTCAAPSALAHSGNPAGADSQFYIMKGASPASTGNTPSSARWSRAMDVVDRIAVRDLIKNVLLK
jgi:cyclophilin family peptidyl-prolyl cis-trans isomerase